MPNLGELEMLIEPFSASFKAYTIFDNPSKMVKFFIYNKDLPLATSEQYYFNAFLQQTMYSDQFRYVQGAYFKTGTF